MSVVLAIVSLATKAVAVSWGLRRAGLSYRSRRRAVAALAARGEFSIIIAEIGVAAGLAADLGPVATAYVLILAITGPVLARVANAGGARGPVARPT